MREIKQWKKRTGRNISAVDYYLDSGGGSDAAAAWKSFEKINKKPLQPGDRVLLKSGSKWKGLLVLKICYSVFVNWVNQFSVVSVISVVR